MKLSIIIATRNRSDSLLEMLKSLSRQVKPSSDSVEVLVVDNGSTDSTPDVVESFIADIPNLKYLYEDSPGKTVALNTGIREAAGEYLAFCDDDVIPEDDWLDEVWNLVRKYRPAAAGGRVLPDYPAGTPEWVKVNKDILDGPIVAHDYGEKIREYNGGMLPFLGANMIVKKEIFEDVGLFRTDLGPGKQTFGDDTELFRRIARHGHKILYAGTLTVRHPVEKNRMNYRYIARWNMDHGRYAVLNTSEKDEDGLATWFGVPRYLFRQVGEKFLQLFLSAFNRRRFLVNWSSFFRAVGMVKAYRMRGAS